MNSRRGLDVMRFRTKVFTLFLLLVIISTTLLVGFIYWPTQKLFLDLMRSNVLSIAATAAAMVNVDDHEKIQSRADQESPDYKKVEQQLRRARDANRRRDLYVKFIYSMRPYDKNPKKAEFVVDAEEDGEDKSNVGDIYKADDPGYQVHFNEFQADEGFVRDQWGVWLTANAPIRDAQGDTVGAVGVDVSAKEAVQRLHGLLWSGALALGLSLIAAYVMASIAANRISAPLIAIRNAVERMSSGDYSKDLKITSKDEMGEVATALNAMSIGLQQREDLKSALARYVSEDILQEVIYAGKASELYSHRKKVTVLFADVRGFTNLSEQVSPEEIVALLNDYFEKMIEAIFKNQGHLNKFMGDGLMALFGALRDDDYQEEHAIQAALDMRRAMEDLKKQWAASDRKEYNALSVLQIGIGINTGLAIVGNIGSKQRMEFTAIGDAVNLASRLEGVTKEMPGVDILVSEYTYVAARNKFTFSQEGEVTVRGKTDTIRTYAIKQAY